MGSHGGKLVAHIVWFVTAIGAIHLGLMAAGYNLIDTLHLGHLARTIDYIFGIAGVLSLIMLVMCMTSSCCRACGADCRHDR